MDRVVETVKVERIVHTQPVEVLVARRPQSVDEFAAVIVDLARRLDSGRIYDRDLPALDAPISAAPAAELPETRTHWLRC